MSEITDEVWITKNGQKIPVSDLTESHAKNILRMLIRKLRKAAAEETENMADVDWNNGEFYK